MLNINDKDKILIVRLTALGDCIHTIPLACAIKKQYPNIFIGWAVSEKCKDIIINNPIIDKVHLIPKNNKKAYNSVIREIKDENYTVSIDSQELLKSAWVSFLSGAKYKLAHDKSREFSHFFANKKLQAIPLFDNSRHVIERNLDFARFLGINNPIVDFVLPETTQEDLKYVENLLKSTDMTKPTVTIAPATTWVTKYWKKEYWAEVLNFLNDKVNIIFTGSQADKNYVKEIIELTKNVNCIDLTGQTNILQLKTLFEKSDIVITPDSGSAHLAAVTKKPIVITLFGATSNIRNGAFGEKHFNLTANLQCQPCNKKVCKYTKSVPECIKALKPQLVIEKLQSILKNEI